MVGKRLAPLASIFLAMACTGPVPTRSPAASSAMPSTGAVTGPTFDPTRAPTNEPDPTSSALEPDRMPDDLHGRSIWRSFEAPRSVVVATLGSADRVRFPGEMSVLGQDGDRVVTMHRTASTWTISVWALASGDRLAGPFAVPSDYQVHQAAGSRVAIATKRGGAGELAGLAFISLTDGTITDLIAPAKARQKHMERVTVVSEGGDLVATSVCETAIDFVGDCRDTLLYDVATGSVVASPDVGGGLVIGVLDAGLLLFAPDHAQLRSARGAVIWTSNAFPEGSFLWDLQPIDTSTLAAVLYSYAAGGSSRILLIDAATGRARTVYKRSGATAPSVDVSLSTPQRLALSLSGAAESCDGDNNGACDPQTIAVVDRATLDVSSGELTKHAIRVTITP